MLKEIFFSRRGDQLLTLSLHRRGRRRRSQTCYEEAPSTRPGRKRGKVGDK